MSEVALSSLNPVYRRIHKDFKPDTGGEPTDEFNLTFHCPVCGPPNIIAINIGPAMDAARAIWQVTPAVPFMGWADVMTVAPSIDYTSVGHGKRRSPCTFHGHIINGRVQFP